MRVEEILVFVNYEKKTTRKQNMLTAVAVVLT